MEKLLKNVDVLQDAVVVLRLIHSLTEQLDLADKASKLIAVIEPVDKMITSSGMVRDELTIWLKGLLLQNDEKSMRDLIELDLMQNELFWQLKKAVRVTNEFVERIDILSEHQKKHLKKLSDYIYENLVTDNLR